jgi:hypothetical protein
MGWVEPLVGQSVGARLWLLGATAQLLLQGLYLLPELITPGGQRLSRRQKILRSQQPTEAILVQKL